MCYIKDWAEQVIASVLQPRSNCNQAIAPQQMQEVFVQPKTQLPFLPHLLVLKNAISELAAPTVSQVVTHGVFTGKTKSAQKWGSESSKLTDSTSNSI